LALNELRDRVRDLYRRAGRRVPPVIRLPTPLFSAVVGAVGVLMPAEARRALKTLPVFLDYLATDQSFANRRTQALLSSAGLPVSLPEQYLDTVLSHYLRIVGSNTA
jgi:hypothetical protein